MQLLELFVNNFKIILLEYWLSYSQFFWPQSICYHTERKLCNVWL